MPGSRIAAGNFLLSFSTLVSGGCASKLSTFVSDRHTTIAKLMREQLPDITHYFDLWHLKKKIHKELTNLAKQNDCKSLEPWVQPCVNHLFWSATSTFDGNGNVIWAKFKSFLSHVIDKHILASIHFNCNLRRESKTTSDGEKQVAVSWPKFKTGQATVRDVRVKQDLGYVREIFISIMRTSSETLKEVEDELKLACPEPMNRMLDRQTRKDALAKKESRDKATSINVPATGEVTDIDVIKKKPHCRRCNQLMKGHKYTDCPNFDNEKE
eukprot:gene4196-20383_t